MLLDLESGRRRPELLEEDEDEIGEVATGAAGGERSELLDLDLDWERSERIGSDETTERNVFFD
jgi:hypothetical protein